MSAAINAVAFGGWDVSVSSAAHHGWLASEVLAPVVPTPSTGDAFHIEDEWERRRVREEEEIISLIVALHEARS